MFCTDYGCSNSELCADNITFDTWCVCVCTHCMTVGPCLASSTKGLAVGRQRLKKAQRCRVLQNTATQQR